MWVLPVLGTFFVTLCVIFLARHFLTASLFLDNPDSVRKMQGVGVPRIGGLAVFVSVMLMLCLFWDMSMGFLWYFLGAFVMVLLGVFDDLFSLKWQFKLSVQFLLGTGLFFLFLSTMDMMTLWGLSFQVAGIMYTLFLLWFLGFVNAVNLLDGMDGLASGVVGLMVACLGGCGYMLGQSSFAMVQWVFLGALLAFWVFNRNPARIYLGDSGSLFLGFHVAMSPFLWMMLSGLGTVSLTPFFILFTYLVWDTSRVFFLRLWDQKNPFKADQRHFHFVLYKRLGSVPVTVRVIYGMNLGFVLVAFLVWTGIGFSGVFGWPFLYGCVCVGVMSFSGVLSGVVRRRLSFLK